MSDAIKIRVTERNSMHEHLSVFESRNGGLGWMLCGELVCSPDIAALFRDVMFRGRGRWDLIWEDRSE
jgi:hypothetical protein